MSLAVLLAQKNYVVVHDIDEDRINKINNKESTILDQDIDIFLKEKKLSLEGTLDPIAAYKDADFIIIATPTNFDLKKNAFDTSSVDGVVSKVRKHNKNALIVIKSTIPIGHTNKLQRKFHNENIIFSPEFLREGKALKDNLYPSRIIVGSLSKKAREFASIMQDSSIKKDTKLLFMNSNDAEAVKLFSNTYLAMRVSFFNELDSYAYEHGLNSKNIIDGVCLDERVGSKYNNPSFGYGGYCLPKDTKQLLANYKNIPQSLIQAIVDSNEIRKDFLCKKVIEKNPSVVGIFELSMKKGSDNFRSAAIHGIIDRLLEEKVKIVIYEPKISDDRYNGLEVINELQEFIDSADIIVANRITDELKKVKEIVFTRDIFGKN